MNLHFVLIALGALVPSAGVAFLFYVVIKAMLEGDRRERLAHSRWEADEERLTAATRKSENIGDKDSTS